MKPAAARMVNWTCMALMISLIGALIAGRAHNSIAATLLIDFFACACTFAVVAGLWVGFSVIQRETNHE